MGVKENPRFEIDLPRTEARVRTWKASGSSSPCALSVYTMCTAPPLSSPAAAIPPSAMIESTNSTNNESDDSFICFVSCTLFCYNDNEESPINKKDYAFVGSGIRILQSSPLLPVGPARFGRCLDAKSRPI